MRALVQRVSRASVEVDGRRVAEIGPGLLVLLGITHDDTTDQAAQLADKVRALRVFSDADGRMNEPLGEREVLCVSQFTLYGDARRGNRPSYVAAARPEVAEPLYDHFCELTGARRGVFGAHMSRRARQRRAGDTDAGEPAVAPRPVSGARRPAPGVRCPVSGARRPAPGAGCPDRARARRPPTSARRGRLAWKIRRWRDDFHHPCDWRHIWWKSEPAIPIFHRTWGQAGVGPGRSGARPEWGQAGVGPGRSGARPDVGPSRSGAGPDVGPGGRHRWHG